MIVARSYKPLIHLNLNLRGNVCILVVKLKQNTCVFSRTMIVDEIIPAEDFSENNMMYNNDVSKILSTTTKYVTGSVTISDSQNLLPNQRTSRPDEFLVDVAELSGNLTSKPEIRIETQDEVVVLFPEQQNESLLKGFILNDTTSQYHCSSCFKAHVTKEELLKHICTEHKTNISRSEMYECDICDQLFIKNIHRNTHRFNVHDISIPLHKNYKVVRTDNQTTPNAAELDDKNSFRCEYCNINFNRLGKLKVHKMRKHGVIYQNIVRCNICSTVLLNKRALRSHIKTAHTRVPNEDSQNKFTISEEYLQFLSERIVYDGEIRYFQCEECLFKCRGLPQFIRHGKRHANANPTCAYCDKLFATKALLQRHIASVHLGIKKFKCGVCGKMFGEKRHMEEHMNLHQESWNYICETCGKQFKQRQTLAVHKQVHRGVKTFACEFCDKAFTFKTKLSNHMKKHTGKNLSICQICGKKFTSSSHLKAHMLSHSDVKPFPCSVCNKNLKSNRSLQQHMDLFHNHIKRNVQQA